MPTNHSRSTPKPWLAALAGLLGVWVAILLPSVHGHIGCEDAAGIEAHACEHGCESDHHSAPVEHSPGDKDHHDSSACDLCKLILTLDSGGVHVRVIEVCFAAVMSIDLVSHQSQIGSSAPALDARCSRGPPAV